MLLLLLVSADVVVVVIVIVLVDEWVSLFVQVISVLRLCFITSIFLSCLCLVHCFSLAVNPAFHRGQNSLI